MAPDLIIAMLHAASGDLILARKGHPDIRIKGLDIIYSGELAEAINRVGGNYMEERDAK
jgi:hypothetical protein